MAGERQSWMDGIPRSATSEMDQGGIEFRLLGQELSEWKTGWRKLGKFRV